MTKLEIGVENIMKDDTIIEKPDLHFEYNVYFNENNVAFAPCETTHFYLTK